MRGLTLLQRGLLPSLCVLMLSCVAAQEEQEAPDIQVDTTGTISGEVCDAETGEPLAGAPVTVEGTFMGALTDPEGRYLIRDVPPGRYRLAAMMVGYRRIDTEEFLVKPGEVVWQEFAMSEGLVIYWD